MSFETQTGRFYINDIQVTSSGLGSHLSPESRNLNEYVVYQ